MGRGDRARSVDLDASTPTGTLTGVLSRATEDPDLLAGPELDALQRTAGNRAVVDLLQRAPTSCGTQALGRDRPLSIATTVGGPERPVRDSLIWKRR